MDRIGPPGAREIRFLGYSEADPDGSPQRPQRSQSFRFDQPLKRRTKQRNTFDLLTHASRRVWGDCPRKRETDCQTPLLGAGSAPGIRWRHSRMSPVSCVRCLRMDVLWCFIQAGGPFNLTIWLHCRLAGQRFAIGGGLSPGGRGSRCFVVRRFRSSSGSAPARGLDRLVPRRGTPAVTANNAPPVPRKPRICCPSCVQGPASRAPRLALIGHACSSTGQPTAHPSESERGCTVTGHPPSDPWQGPRKLTNGIGSQDSRRFASFSPHGRTDRHPRSPQLYCAPAGW